MADSGRHVVKTSNVGHHHATCHHHPSGASTTTTTPWWASLKGAPPRRQSLLRVASTEATNSRRPPFSPVVFFEHIPATVAAYGIPRRLSSFLNLPQQCGEESSSSSYRCQVRAFSWSSSTEGWSQHHQEEAREESHKKEPIPHHQLWLVFWRCFILSARL
jgi:hypothetical protein